MTTVYVWEVERGCICFSLETTRGREVIFYIEIQRSGCRSIGLRDISLSIEWGRGFIKRRLFFHALCFSRHFFKVYKDLKTVSERRRPVRPGYRRLSIFLPEDLYLEIHGIAGRSVSGWIEEVLRERLEIEKRKRMLGLLPEPLREKLVRTAGSEEAAVHLLAKVVEKGLAEIEEEEDEELVQEVIGEANERERLAQLKQASKSLSGRG